MPRRPAPHAAPSQTTPVTFASPTKPAGWTLGGDERRGRRALRRPARAGRALRPEHLARPARRRRRAPRRGASSRSRCPSTRRRTTAADRRGRGALRRRARGDPRRRRRGRDPRPRRQGVHPARRRRRSCRSRPTRCTRSSPSSAAPRSCACPRRPRVEVFALDVEAVRAAVRAPPTPPIDLIWLCNPNNPTATAEPAGVVAALLAGLLADAAAAGRREPVVLLDEAYVEFGGESRPAASRRPTRASSSRGR